MGPKYISIAHRKRGVMVHGANQTKPGISSIRPGCSLPTNASPISDLLGRHFVEPELGVCCITALGPIGRKHANTRAERNQLRAPGAEPPIPAGLHYNLYYNQLLTQTEYLSSVNEILNWIQIGPVLPPNVEDANVNGTLPITTPPATALLYVPMIQPSAVSEAESLPLAVTNSGPLVNINEQMPDLNTIPVTNATTTPPITSIASDPGVMCKSTRNRTTRDFLKPKFQGKAYHIGKKGCTTTKNKGCQHATQQ
jgi:hypothetical protein